MDETNNDVTNNIFFLSTKIYTYNNKSKIYLDNSFFFILLSKYIFLLKLFDGLWTVGYTRFLDFRFFLCKLHNVFAKLETTSKILFFNE